MFHARAAAMNRSKGRFLLQLQRSSQNTSCTYVIRVYVWNDLDCTVFSDFSKPKISFVTK